jgi:hypothetical protein
MVKAEANRLSHEERIQLLASEIAIRAIYDLRLLQRRKVLVGEELAPPDSRPRLTDCCSRTCLTIFATAPYSFGVGWEVPTSTRQT